MDKQKNKEVNSLFEYYGFSKKEAEEYPVISGILKELTPGRIKKEIEEVQKVELPEEVQRWVKEYEEIGERSEFIWMWLWKMFQITKLPISPKKHEKTLLTIKVLLTMFIVLLDDIADKGGSKKMLDEMSKIPFVLTCDYKGFNKIEKKHLKKASSLWKYLEAQIKKLPEYESYKEIFEYDLRQVINAMRYSSLVNKNHYLLNKTECWQFMPYNMAALVYSGLDLMCVNSPMVDKNMGKIREIIIYSQKMARIGNWISTWEREIYEKDFTNIVFIYAIIDYNFLRFKDLSGKGNEEKIIQKIKSSKIENELFESWEKYYQKIKKEVNFENKVPFTKFLSSLERLMVFHLSSRNYK